MWAFFNQTQRPVEGVSHPVEAVSATQSRPHTEMAGKIFLWPTFILPLAAVSQDSVDRTPNKTVTQVRQPANAESDRWVVQLVGSRVVDHACRTPLQPHLTLG